jgi:hypothetical protein
MSVEQRHRKVDPLGWLVNLDVEWIRQLQTLCKATAAEQCENDD